MQTANVPWCVRTTRVRYCLLAACNTCSLLRVRRKNVRRCAQQHNKHNRSRPSQEVVNGKLQAAGGNLLTTFYCLVCLSLPVRGTRNKDVYTVINQRANCWVAKIKVNKKKISNTAPIIFFNIGIIFFQETFSMHEENELQKPFFKLTIR
jgi:hypothetical protein